MANEVKVLRSKKFPCITIKLVGTGTKAAFSSNLHTILREILSNKAFKTIK